MIPEDVIAGLQYAEEHELTPREIEVLMYFFVKPYTVSELAQKSNISKSILHPLLQRLRLKGVISIKDRNANGSNILQLKV